MDATTINTTDRQELPTAAERELAALSYAISHDLRAPVRALMGFTDALSEYQHSLAPEAQQYLGHIHTAAERLQQMINGLLELSRLSQLPVTPSDVALPALIERVANTVRQQHVALHPALHIATDLAIRCDANLLSTALRALVDNAWKFTALVANPSISISAQQHQGTVTLCVADNGIGMDLRHATHFGAPFQHFHPQQGTRSLGLGLATAQRCATRMGGKLWAESSPQQGCKVYLQITTDTAA